MSWRKPTTSHRVCELFISGLVSSNLLVHRMKNLIPVKFTFFNAGGGSSRSVDSTPADGSRKEDADPMCPSCKKKLSNNSHMYCTLFAIFSCIFPSLIIYRQWWSPVRMSHAKHVQRPSFVPRSNVSCATSCWKRKISWSWRERVSHSMVLLANGSFTDRFFSSRYWICWWRSGRDVKDRSCLPRLIICTSYQPHFVVARLQLITGLELRSDLWNYESEAKGSFRHNINVLLYILAIALLYYRRTGQISI